MDDDALKRRDFLKAGAGSIIGGGLLSACGEAEEKPPPELVANDAQKSLYPKEKEFAVALKTCADYKADIAAAIADHAQATGLTAVAGKSVFLKMNLVDHRPGRPLTTDAAVVAAAIRVAADLGAKSIAVGDGSALNRDTQYLLSQSGIGAVLKKLSVPFVDLNIDDLVKVPNQARFTKEDSYLLPKSVMESEFVISMPKMKTHRWAKMTCSMKNLFGAVPGRIYGWPKNLLHVNGITASIIDIACAIKTSFAIVDAIVAMEGNGPLDGTAVDAGFIVYGANLAAVDSVCAHTMDIDPHTVRHLKLASQVIGPIDMEAIKLLGDPLDGVKKKFKLPANFGADGNPAKSAGSYT